MSELRAIAFYLPQFHPIPENDEWWGKGFTEWTNVTKSKPKFRGHYQPHLPADLGFYDLRLPETRQAQADLARQYGIHGFCYYHYWFNGRRVIERPFQEVLKSGSPDFPFCLCWANENWSRRWDGQDQELLLSQSYGPEDDIAHIEHLLEALHDPRYIRVDNKPLLIVYRVNQLPNPQRTFETWRERAIKSGLPGLFLCNVEGFPDEHGMAQNPYLDAAVEFAPDWMLRPPRVGIGRWNGLKQRLRNYGKIETGYVENSVGDYGQMAANMMAKPPVPYLRFPGVSPMWDNSARRANAATILVDSRPDLYEKWLREVAKKARTLPEGKQILFINAWNEWAEGNHLEPCLRWGHAYLEATQRGLKA